MAKKKSSSKTDTVDFSGLDKEIRQRGRHIPGGDYALKIVKHKKKWKDDDRSNVPYYDWVFQVIEGKHKGVPLYGFNTSLKPDALFNLRNLIFAASDGAKNVAGKKLKFDPTSLWGKKVMGIVEDDEYKGKIRSRVVDVRPISELEESDEDEDEDSDDEDEDEDEDDEDEDEDDEDEDEDDEDDEEEEEPPKKKKKKKKKTDDDDLDEVDIDDV